MGLVGNIQNNKTSARMKSMSCHRKKPQLLIDLGKKNKAFPQVSLKRESSQQTT